MTPVHYVAVANIIGDDLSLPNGTQRRGILGGAGTYAAAGMRIWSDHVGIVSGVGEDFEDMYGSWFDQNQIAKLGLHVRAPNTPRSWINYKSADERTEVPQFGTEHFKLMEPTIDDIPTSYLGARGIYFFRDTDSEYWNKVFEIKGKHHFTTVWEIHAGAANAENWDRVSTILSRIELFSINLAEATQLCGLTEPIRIIEKLLSTGIKGVALRSGSLGTIIASPYGVWRIAAYQTQVTDVTGAGNAFTGGFLVGYCESNSNIAIAGQYGAVSASFILEQHGPPSRIDDKTYQLAQMRCQSLTPVRIA
mgnify:CR=1 FL=1